MCYLTNICLLCLKNNIKVQSVLFQDTDGIYVNEKLRSFFPEIIDSIPDSYKLSCSPCLEKLRISYDFKQSVIRNNTIFRDYIEKLQFLHKTHQQLARSKHRTNLPVTRDDTAKKVDKCSEKHETNNLKCQNENLNPTSTNQEQLNMQDIEKIYIKEEQHVDDDFSSNYFDEDSKEYEDTNSTSSHSGDIDDQTNKKTTFKRWFTCSECPKTFTAPRELEKHSRMHTRDRPFVCQICQKTFTQSSSLHRHKLTHTGQKPHSCDICQKSFCQKSNLLTHKRSHDNVRPYQCSVCKKTFTQTSHLTIHMYIHSGKKPYHCHMCDYKSTQSGDLKYHMRTHTGERPYPCNYCRKSYVRPSHLKVHLKKHHKDEIDTQNMSFFEQSNVT